MLLPPIQESMPQLERREPGMEDLIHSSSELHAGSFEKIVFSVDSCGEIDECFHMGIDGNLLLSNGYLDLNHPHSL